ncbi:MAG: MMPL family transporter [Thermomicrobiales bacterium]|nr:MMPL family transporter [Thermomicrobiales bacterium]
MASRLSLRRLAGACARHPWRVVGAWGVIFLLSMVVTANGLTGVLSNDFVLTTDFDSVVGSRELANSSLSDSIGVGESIVIRSLDGTIVDDPAFRETTTAIVAAVRAEQGTWEGTDATQPPDLMALANDTVEGSYVLNYFEVQDALSNPLIRNAADQMGATEQIEALVSADRTTLLVPVVIGTTGVDIAHYIDVVNAFDSNQFSVTSIGNLSINEVYQEVVAEELVKAEMIGIPIAIVVLLIVFGSLVAPIVPLLLGVMSVGLALGLVTLIGQFTDLQLFVQNMITMLGLAVGIDYSLFMVERFREQRSRGQSKQLAIEIAGATSGKAVVFSGLTLILAMLGVMLVRLNIFFSLSVGAIVVVACSVVLSATLVPALLSLVGDHIDWPRRKPVHAEDIDAHNMYQGFWGRITKVVVDRPWVSFISAVIVLLVLAFPVVNMQTGFSRSGQLPPGEMTDAYQILEQDFSAGLLSPVYIVFVGEQSEEADAAIADYVAQMQASDDFVTISAPRWDDAGRVAEIQATLAFEGSSERAYEVVDRLRGEIAESTLGDIDGLRVHITGQSAGENDMLHHLQERTPLVFAFVLGLSFVLLLLAFRSVVVPLQAILFNVLSVGAAWGIMVGVFSEGIGRDLLGYNSSEIVEMWLPILMFCVLFGLSMDYHVFIVSRIREHYDISHDNHESVAVGLRSTGKIITGAAAIMVVVFSAFSKGSMLAIQQLGFGLAVAVLIDATIIRSVLVPSAMTIVGDKNWYLPKWLHWLPDLRIEGNHEER